MKKTLTVSQADTLLPYLFRALPEAKRTVIKQGLKHGCVAVNGRVQTRFDHPLRPGDEVRIDPSPSRALTPSAQFNLEIVHDDDSIIVINKPAGLLTISTEKIRRETAIFTMNDYLNKKEAGKRPSARLRKQVFIVHRLDRDVSGLLLLAKNEPVKLKLQHDWDQFKKEYLAVVEGAPEESSGTCTSYLAQNKILRVYSTPRPVTPDAKRAVTHYEVIKSGGPYSLVRVRLETGRKHQIRVHLAALGCPVAGDLIYGAKTRPAARILLHARRLEIKHPVTGKNLAFTSDPPAAFYRCVPGPEL